MVIVTNCILVYKAFFKIHTLTQNLPPPLTLVVCNTHLIDMQSPSLIFPSALHSCSGCQRSHQQLFVGPPPPPASPHHNKVLYHLLYYQFQQQVNLNLLFIGQLNISSTSGYAVKSISTTSSWPNHLLPSAPPSVMTHVLHHCTATTNYRIARNIGLFQTMKIHPYGGTILLFGPSIRTWSPMWQWNWMPNNHQY